MRKTRSSVVDVLFTLALFCVFSATALGITLIGSKVYSNSAKAMENRFNSSTAISYMKEKIHQHDHLGGITVEEIDGRSILVLTDETKQGKFKTLIYQDGGVLKELFVPFDSKVGLSAGQTIVPVKEFRIKAVESGLYKITIVGTDSIKQTVLVAVQSEGGQ